jgi:tRNA pseudouridine synthase 10
MTVAAASLPEKLPPLPVALCARCILRYLSLPFSHPLYLADDAALSQLLNSTYASLGGLLQADQVCPACIGILQNISDECAIISLSTLSKLCQPYSSSCKSFILAASLPSICLFREACILSHLDNRPVVTSIKDLVKALLFPIISRAAFNSQPDSLSPFHIDLKMSHAPSEEELTRKVAPFMQRTIPKNINSKGLRRTSITSSNFIEKALSVITREELQAIPLIIENNVPVDGEMTVYHNPVFLTGSYLKFCRELSQTPWLIDEKRKQGCSVQELVAAPIITHFGIDRQYKFHSAGREDVDVRMLGSGRHFIVEIIDPHNIPRQCRLEEFRNTINESTDRIQVHSLALTMNGSAEFKKLDDGARSKSYDFFLF